MAKYLLKGELIDEEEFEAMDDEGAEEYVEMNYDEDDGSMTLYTLKAIVSWP